MSELKLNLTLAKTAGLSILLSTVLSSCVQTGDGTGVAVTPQGTISLDKCKAGMPESVYKNAMLTFILDPTPGASLNGKSQYVSRKPDANGGQYVAQCKDDKCFELDVLYKDKPVSKEVALQTLGTVIPGDAQPQSRTDDRQLQDAKKFPQPMQLYVYGDNQYGALLCFTDSKADHVSQIKAFNVPPETIRVILTGRPAKDGATAGAGAGSAEKPQTAAGDTEPKKTEN